MKRPSDELIELCEKLGLGLEINNLRGTVTVDTVIKGKREFKHVLEALEFVRDMDKRVQRFRTY